LPAVYTSGSIALAVLESLVHMDIAHAGPHVVIPATIPDGVAIETLDITRLPENWYATPAPAVLRDFGSDWLKTQRTAVLAVPSAIVNDEPNYLLNPAHPDFAHIIIGTARPFAFNGRLWSAP
jgi:RES domain-containing protein